MAGMNGIGRSSSIYSQASQLPGFGGLASGLDRDSLIEQMTMGTRAKIAKMNQKIDLVKWTQESIRGITDKMYNFTNKYTSFSSSSNLISSNLFAKNEITAVGENSKYVSIAGNATGKNQFSILGVKQTAQNAQISSGDTVSDSALTSKPINFDKKQEFSKVAGETITFSTGTTKKTTYSITIPAQKADGTSFDLSSAAGVKDALNYAIEEYNKDNPIKLNISVDIDADKNKLVFKNTGDPSKDNNVTIDSISSQLETSLGLKPAKEGEKTTIDCGQSFTGTAISKDTLMGQKSMAELLEGESLVFNYNGEKKKITFTEADLYNSSGDGKVDKTSLKINTADDYKALLQSKMDEAFGKGRVEVALGAKDKDGAQTLSFTTKNPNGNTVDDSSVLSLVSGPNTLVGKNGAFGIETGASNRVNLTASIESSGIKGIKADTDGMYRMEINGVKFEFGKDNITVDGKKTEFIGDVTLKDVIKTVNESKAGVTLSYNSLSDKFVIDSKEKGASGKIQLSGGLADAMFGKSGTAEGCRKEKLGQDAIVSIKFEGQDNPIEMIRDSNTFDVEGLKVTVKGEFGYTANGNVDTDPSKQVTFEASMDTKKTVDVVKDMVKDINDIIELVNKEMRTKPNRDFHPLTEEQKKEMSEDEIKKWEEQGKKGLLFNDRDVRGLANALRFTIPSSLKAEFKEMGITVSTEYKDNGKLVVDEEKLKAALEKDPQRVRELFAGDGTEGNKGLMGNIKAKMDIYGATTGAKKGILVERAGSSHAPLSMLTNKMLTEINEYNRVINGLNDRLKNEQDRYIKQFTSLETLISQMNSQSSYFAGMMGGY